MENRAQPLSTENRVQVTDEYQSNIIKVDMAKELLEEEDTKVVDRKTGLTEVIVTIEGKNFKSLIDTERNISSFWKRNGRIERNK